MSKRPRKVLRPAGGRAWQRTTGTNNARVTQPATPPAAQPRVLFLSSFFPRPGNERMGVWAMGQARALARAGVPLRVVSMSPWLPRALGALKKGKSAWFDCPDRHVWPGAADAPHAGVETFYPRVAYYPVPPFRARAYRDPAPFDRVLWASAKNILRRHVREHRPDVIFCHHTYPNGGMAQRLAREFNLPYIIGEYDFNEIQDSEQLPGRRAFYQRVAGRADAWIAASSPMLRTMQRLFPTSRPTVVHHATDPPPAALFDTPRPADIAGKTVILYVGAFFPRKGVPLLIDAFSAIAAKHPDAILRIVGGSDHGRPEVDAAIAKANLGPRVQLVGPKPHAQIFQEIIWSDVFASIGWEEPFATVFLEAAACARPMIWASDGGIVDVLTDGEHGVMVEPKSRDSAIAALDRLLSDPAARARMGPAAREQWSRAMSWETPARKLIALFQQCAAHRRAD